MVADHPLTRCLNPSSIALFGTSSVASVIKQCQNLGFSGDLWPIHPTRESIGGVKCFKSIDELPRPADVAFVAVNRNATIAVITQLEKVGAGGAVCYASGFAESGEFGVELQRQLVAVAKSMPVFGPNCYGYINALDGVALWPDEHGCEPVNNGVAIVSQSGNVGLNLTLQNRGLDLAYLVTVGNQAIIGVEDCLEAFIADSRVTAIGLFIEAIVDPIRFANLAQQAYSRNLRIVALHTGRSATGAQIAASHTASLAGRASSYQAFFARCGVALVDTPTELIETLKLLHTGGPLTGNKIVSLSCSGGEASLVADLAEKTALVFEPFSETHHKLIASTLSELVSISNPFDYHTFMWGDRQATAKTFTAVMDGPQDATLLILDTPQKSSHDAQTWVIAAAALADAAKSTNKRGVVVSTFPECVTPEIRSAASDANIVVLQGLSESLKALQLGAWLTQNIPSRPPVAVHTANNTHQLNEAEGKQLLKQHGVTVANGLQSTRDNVTTTAITVGYPITLKGLGVAHKSEVGGVVVGIANELALQTALAKMPETFSDFLVEQTITNIVAEILVSVRRDPPVGWLITLGCGGIHTELWRDTTFLLANCTDSEILQALAKLRIAPLLKGFRGKPAGSVKHLVALVQKVVATAINQEIVEIELNPVLVTPDSAVVVDALIVVAKK